MKKVVRVLAWVIGSVLALVLLVAVLVAGLLYVPAIQRLAVGQGVKWFNRKTGANASIGKLHLLFPHTLTIEDLYVDDSRRDTLVYMHHLEVDVDFLGLLGNKIHVSDVQLDGLTARVYQTLPDSTYNFDYIVKAFVGQKAKNELEEPPKDTTKSALNLRVDRVLVTNVRLDYSSQAGGDTASLRLGYLRVEPKVLDLDSMRFEIDQVALAGTAAQYTILKRGSSVSPPDTVPMRLSLKLNRLDVQETGFLFDDKVGHIYLDSHVGHHQLDGLAFSLHESTVALGRVLLDSSTIAFRQGQDAKRDTLLVEKVLKKGAEQREDAGIGTDTTDPNHVIKGLAWRIKVDEIAMAGNTFQYDDATQPRQPRGMDYAHLRVIGFGTRLRRLGVSAEELHMDADDLHFEEQSGFVMQKMQMRALLTQQQARLENMVVQTPHTRLHNQIILRYKGLENIAKNLPALAMDIDLGEESGNRGESYVGMPDVLLFVPDLRKQPVVRRNGNLRTYLFGRIAGTVGQLELDRVGMALLNNTRMQLTGTIKGLPKVQTAWMDLPQITMTTSARDLTQALPPGTIPATVRVPEQVAFKGDFLGSIDNFDTRNVLTTSRGIVATTLHLQPHRTDLYTYDANINVKNFNVGYVTKNPALGPITLRFGAKGSGFDTSNLHTDLGLIVDKFYYNGYTYQSVKLKGRIDKSNFDGDIESADSALDLRYKGQIDINPNHPKYNFQLAVQRAWLHRLNLVGYPVSVRGNLTARGEGKDVDEIEARVDLRDVTVRKLDKWTRVDSLVLTAEHGDSLHSYKVRSDVFDFTLEGNIIPSKLGTTMVEHIDRYFPVGNKRKVAAVRDMVNGPIQRFDMTMDMKRPEVLRETVLPDLRRLELERFAARFDAQKLALNFEIDMPTLEYGSFGLYNMTLNTEGSAAGIKVNIGIDSLGDSTTKVRNMLLASQLRLGVAEGRLTIFKDPIQHDLRKVRDSSDRKNVKLFAIGAKVDHPEDSTYRVSLLDREFIVNDSAWNVRQDNYIELSSPPYIHQLELSQGDARLLVNSPRKGEDDIEILFDKFGLGFISQILQEKVPLIAGYVSGKAAIVNLKPATQFDADLKIEKLAFRESQLGTLSIKAQNPVAERYDVDINLSELGNKVRINGSYNTAPNATPLNFAVNLQPVQLASIQSLTFGQLADAKGRLEGTLNVVGPTTKPTITGQLAFRDARFKATYVNTYFSLVNEAIQFDGSTIRFPNFTIRDSANRPAQLAGYIDASNLANMQYHLDFSTQKFQVMNTNASSEQPYYGRVLVRALAKVRGPQNHLNIDANVGLLDGSDVYYTVPNEEPSTVNVEGLVEFVHYRHPIDTLELASPRKDTGQSAQFQSMDMRMVLEIDPQTRATVIIDPETGDRLLVQGGGVLTLAILPGGRMTLTGRYEVQDGMYRLSVFNLVRREFRLGKGSYIVWNGQPLNANMNIQAVYSLRASPIDLLADQTAALPESERNKYKQQLPFDVTLNLGGQIMKPAIDFDLAMPVSYRNVFGGAVDARLRQLNSREDEVNKQVFALLVLNSFLPSNGTRSQAGTSLNAQARQSAGRLVANQVNALSDRLVQGVDLDFDVDSYDDYSSGKTRTDLNVGVNKQLFNNRVNVSVGSTVNVEGGQNNGAAGANSATGQNAFVGNVIIEYSITEDGRYRFKAFRTGNTRSLAEGTITETGLSVLFTKDYDNLRYLFDKSNAEDPENLTKEQLQARFSEERSSYRAKARKRYERNKRKNRQ